MNTLLTLKNSQFILISNLTIIRSRNMTLPLSAHILQIPIHN